MNSLVIALAGLVPLLDPAPADADVKAGWGAFGIFLGLVAATALLCWSMVRHLKKSKLNADAGAFGDESGPEA
jgi:apolipoprotein N-acyltransferase